MRIFTSAILLFCSLPAFIYATTCPNPQLEAMTIETQGVFVGHFIMQEQGHTWYSLSGCAPTSEKEKSITANLINAYGLASSRDFTGCEYEVRLSGVSQHYDVMLADANQEQHTIPLSAKNWKITPDSAGLVCHMNSKTPQYCQFN